MDTPASPPIDDGQRLSEAIGRQVREARERQGLSIRAAAQQLRCSPRFVHEFEHGKPTARLDKVLHAIAGLGLEFSVRAPGGSTTPELLERASARAQQAIREQKLARAHERIAAMLALDELGEQDLDRARAQVAKWSEHQLCSQWYVAQWTGILDGAPRDVAARLIRLAPGDAKALFQNTPFGFLVRNLMHAAERAGDGKATA